jgi:hypothetical protein
LVSSTDPEIVSIDAFGNLVGHRNGTAIVRGTGGAILQVVVSAVSVLQVAPDRVELVAGKSAPLKVTGDGRNLPAGSYRWETTDPSTAVISGSTVLAGFTAGTATLTLRSGAATATLAVVVREPKFEIRLRGPQGAVKRGSIERLVAEVPAGIPVEWTSSNRKVLEALRDGSFYARSRGSAEVCASAGSRRACKRLSVR